MLKLYLCKTYAEAIVLAGKKASEFDKNPARKMFAFCEDKLTMSLEREVASACGGGTFNVQVTSFSRFISRNLRLNKTVLDKEASAMAVKRILLEKANTLTCFNRSAFNPGTAITLYELIAQLKSANVSVNDLSIGVNSLTGALRGKIKDIISVYSDYENYIAEHGYLDSNSYLSLMVELLNNGNFQGCSAMLVGFSSLTKQGIEIVKALSNRMENLYVFLLSGDNNQLYTNELKDAIMREIDGFSLVESAIEYSTERKKIMDGLFDPSTFSAPLIETDNVFIYEAVDYNDEIKHIASIIRREVVSGKRYKDFAVALGNPSAYRATLIRVFGDYSIPFFLDDPKILSSHPLAKLAISYLDVLRRFTINEIIAFEKNPYFQPDKEISDKFENFIKRNALTIKTIKSGLNLTENPEERYGKDFELFETERKRVLDCFFSADTVSDCVMAIKKLLAYCGAEKTAEEQAKKLAEYGDPASAAFTRQAFIKLNAVLDSVDNVLGNVKMPIVDFRNILLSGLTACKISVIPQLADAVYVGDYKECKYIEHKILFAGGLSGEVPFTKSDTAVLTDKDLLKLEKFDCIVEPKIKIVNRRERENVGAALVSFSEKLYLSSSSTDANGKLVARSRINEYFSAMFKKGGVKLAPTSASSLRRESLRNKNFARNLEVMNFNAPRPAMANFIGGASDFKSGKKDDFTVETAYFSVLRDAFPEEAKRAEEYLSKRGASLVKELKTNGDLIFYKDTLSASILEKYFACPFSCFLKYGLKLKEREEGEIQANEYGTFLHAVLEKYVEILKSDLDSENRRIVDKKSSDDEVEKISNNLLGDPIYARYIETDKYKVMFAFAKKEAKRVAFAILKQFENSLFRPVETEARFRDGAKYPSLKLKTPYGEKKINGMIDRVDRYKEYVRIIDYKTGATHEEDENFYTGNNLQLYLYMNAFLGASDKPVGAYYFPVSDSYQEKEAYVYAMRGKTLESEDVIKATDESISLENPSCELLDLNFKYKDGILQFPSNKKVIDEEVFRAYLKYAMLVSEKGAEEIAEGVIAPSPYSGKCLYCEYSAICGFEAEENKERKEKDVNPMTILDATEVENESN